MPGGVADLVAGEVGDGAVQVCGELRLFLEQRVAADDPFDRLAVGVLEIRVREARELASLDREDGRAELFNALRELAAVQLTRRLLGSGAAADASALTASPAAGNWVSRVSATKSAIAHVTERRPSLAWPTRCSANRRASGSSRQENSSQCSRRAAATRRRPSPRSRR